MREHARNLDSYVDDYYSNDPYERVHTELFTRILELVGELYQAYHRSGSDVQGIRVEVENSLGRLMAAWDRMLE